jgi:dihydroxyacid dehydratase/phosphogluconate dehydratase
VADGGWSESFQTISDKIPVLADFKPSGKYLMEDLHQYGGVPAVMKYLWKNEGGYVESSLACLSLKR